MSVIVIAPDQAALALPALRVIRPGAKPTASAQALATFLTVAGLSGYRLIGSFDRYQGTSAEALAVLGYRIVPTLAVGRVLEVTELAVLPEARGEGHRAALLRWAQAEAARQGCEVIQLELGLLSDSLDDTDLYRSLGWELSGKYYAKELRPAC